MIGGRDDLSILAWSDIGPPSPKVHVYRYAEPLDIISLAGKRFVIHTKGYRSTYLHTEFIQIEADCDLHRKRMLQLPIFCIAWPLMM